MVLSECYPSLCLGHRAAAFLCRVAEISQLLLADAAGTDGLSVVFVLRDWSKEEFKR